MLGLNSVTPLNSNLIGNISKTPIGLTQFKDVNMPIEFTDNTGVKWRLAKSAKDASVEIPDPSMVALTRWWNHVHPSSNGKVFLYVVEGIKRPRIDSENAVMVLYQWYSTNNRPNFTPNDITAPEWYNANVYTANIVDSRISLLQALCGVNREVSGNSSPDIPELDPSLIGVNNDDSGTGKTAGKSDKPYKK